MTLIERLRQAANECSLSGRVTSGADIHDAAAALELCGEVLREAEWCCVTFARRPTCPCCQRHSVDGHAPDCKLAAAIRAVEGEEGARDGK